MENYIHSISIYPNGLDESGQYTKPAKIFFSSREEKEKYIRREFSFSLKEWKICESSFPMKNIIKAREILLKKRVRFALSMNYGPEPNDKNVWTRNNTNDDNDIA
jgi:hypothetical protein